MGTEQVSRIIHTKEDRRWGNGVITAKFKFLKTEMTGSKQTTFMLAVIFIASQCGRR